jgi:hypothetical protein
MRWRKASYSQGNSACVELGQAGDRVLVRNSKHPERTVLDLPSEAVAAFVATCRAGGLDDLTT